MIPVAFWWIHSPGLLNMFRQQLRTYFFRQQWTPFVVHYGVSTILASSTNVLIYLKGWHWSAFIKWTRWTLPVALPWYNGINVVCCCQPPAQVIWVKCAYERYSVKLLINILLFSFQPFKIHPVDFRLKTFVIHFAAVVQDGTTAAQPDAERPKKRVVYTTKKKKPTAAQQDTEFAPGYSLFGFV